MSYQVRASKPIASEFIVELSLDEALDYAIVRLEDGFFVTLIDSDTGQIFDQHQIWEMKAARPGQPSLRRDRNPAGSDWMGPVPAQLGPSAANPALA